MIAEPGEAFPCPGCGRQIAAPFETSYRCPDEPAPHCGTCHFGEHAPGTEPESALAAAAEHSRQAALAAAEAVRAEEGLDPAE